MIPYQFALRRRMMNTPKKITITLSGTFSTSSCYVLVDGVKYTSSQTIEAKAGAEIVVYTSPVASSNRNTFNGSNYSEKACTFNAHSDVSVATTKIPLLYYKADTTCTNYKNLVYS